MSRVIEWFDPDKTVGFERDDDMNLKTAARFVTRLPNGDEQRTTDLSDFFIGNGARHVARIYFERSGKRLTFAEIVGSGWGGLGERQQSDLPPVTTCPHCVDECTGECL
ncbi:hypothetical protein [Methylocystis hirsuta]|uniref:Uncharacterized protein n=1 Tax=Methylocystis hirsuta TaxID=369798 RepID=A0A3M9XQP6_9HYPH|nr:hypothetical protein [Methylocystis hirsuta]RNJ49428.1 hypothetical protein D1O30_07230 [Methylocystis hirsuta]